MSGFGSFEVLCKEVPSYPLCNLFFRQLQKTSPSTVANATSAPVGINPVCGIPRAGTNGSLGNIANIVLCALSIGAVATLIRLCSRRKAAVGRIEFRVLLLWYLLSLPLQILTTGSVLEQGSIPLVILTAVHAGTVATLFWTLLANAIVATQVVEDGTLSSLIPFHGLALIIFTATSYISLDTAFNFTTVFISAPPTSLNNIGLFVLTSIWPAFCALAYFSIMAYVVVINLRETKPLWMLTLSLILLILSQLAYFLLSKVVCSASGAKVDGAFIATILETASVSVLFWAWRTITEDSWDEAWYPTAG